MTRLFFPKTSQSCCSMTQTSWIVLIICTIIVIIQVLNNSPKKDPSSSTTISKATTANNKQQKSQIKSSSSVGASLLPYLNDDNNHKVYFGGNRKQRQVIHCYYQNVDYSIALQKNPTLRTWADMWSDIGWDPVLLSLDDARKHPDFVKHVADGLDISNARNTRYLAMSVVPGGGWYAEKYVFPLHPIQPSDNTKKSGYYLPNNGKFTGHDRHVPSLLSGTQNEWIRIAHALLQHPLEEDQLALHDMHVQDESSYEHENNVISYRALSNNPKNLLLPKLCHVTKNKRAIRISPEDVSDKLENNGQQQQSFSEFTRSFMSKWRSACLVDRPIS